MAHKDMKGGIRDAAYIAHQRANRFRALRQQGYNDTQISRMENVSLSIITKTIGKRNAPNKRLAHKIYVRSESFRRAQQVAAELGYTIKTGPRADETGSVGHLLEAIGDGYVTVRKLEEHEMADRWLHLSDFTGEATGTGAGDNEVGDDPEGDTENTSGLLSFPEPGQAFGDEAGAEGVLPEHHADV
jgi:hypothetical protein